MDIQECFDKVNDTRCYNLHMKIPTLNQGTASIFVYYSKLKDLWDETESIVPTPGCDCVKTKEFIVHLQKQKVYQFLMGLNDSNSQARSQILMMKSPTVNKVYAMLMSDKSQRTIAASAGVLGYAPNVSTNSYDSTALYSAKPNFNQKFRKNYNVQYELCKMKGPNKENCYKIIGYPQDYKFKKQRGAGTHNAMIEPSHAMPLHTNHVSQNMSMTPMPMQSMSTYHGHQYVSQATEGLQG
ncbi:uncharacterized protein [Nicotiana sylvestris]|uniref:uncharacterized protein n=1 Tax=Nicotiana sylvestris TaxID=4096 RepID=UPI00388C4BD9